jgi:putative ABC transport system permease protein
MHGYGSRDRRAIDGRICCFNLPRCRRPLLLLIRPSLSMVCRGLRAAVSQQMATATFGALLLAAFSAGTLLLAAIGLYGLVAYVVGLSRREIAVRLALGATPASVTRLVCSKQFDACGRRAAGRRGRCVYGGIPWKRSCSNDANRSGAYAVVGATLVVVTFIANAVPAVRAVRVDPHVGFRAD